MDRNKKDLRWLRIIGALLLGLLLLAALLPSTGGIISGPAPNPKMWRCGPFLFFPDAFFGVVGTITVATACTVLGIVRRNCFELIGWVFLGIVLVGMFFT